MRCVCALLTLCVVFLGLSSGQARSVWSSWRILNGLTIHSSTEGTDLSHSIESVNENESLSECGATCSIDGTCTGDDSTSSSIVIDELALAELQKMNWTVEAATVALQACNNDVEAAATMLQEQQEYAESIDQLALQIEEQHGWTRDAARFALLSTNGSVEAALLQLPLNEKLQLEEFEASVLEMVESGWDEVVARQALLAQYSLEQQRSNGVNTTVPREALDKLRPSLRLPTESPSSHNDQKSTETSPAVDKAVADKPSIGPPAVKKEEVVFEATAETLESLVLRSPVPVALDIYADWCGPCKQLTPLLEDVAMKAQGSLRIVKINADKQRPIVELLGVTGFPTVFAVTNGEVTDRFVGLPSKAMLQQFFQRAVLKTGQPVCGKEFSAEEMKSLSQSLARFCGMASLSFKKRSKLQTLAEEALALSDAFDISMDPHAHRSRYVASKAVLHVISLLDNAQKNIQSAEVKSMTLTADNPVMHSKAAVGLLRAAGYRLADESVTNSTEQKWSLIHSNCAILEVVSQHAKEVIQSKRFVSVPARKDDSSSSRAETPRRPHNSNERHRSH